MLPSDIVDVYFANLQFDCNNTYVLKPVRKQNNGNGISDLMLLADKCDILHVCLIRV